MKRILLALCMGLLLPSAASAFQVSGRFLYEDRLYDGNGYTGQVQNLPIRRALVEVVDALTMQTLGEGATNGDGFYPVEVAGQALPVTFYVRCSTDGRSHQPAYQIRVVDNFFRVPTVGLEMSASLMYAISTSTVIAHNPALNIDFGTFLIQDTDGTGVAQAFNIFDNAVDFFDWLAGLHGALPTEDEFVVYAWKATGTPANPPPAFGSNYSQQGIFIGANPNEDTDGWSDTVILHETGHWLDDVFLASDNPGGAHFIGDNNANVLLSYGEGVATFHCGKVREYRATTRTNLLGQPVDNLVSLYADLLLPPPVGTPGGLSFSYDFETGNFANTNLPIGQIGSANETNVTSALWDLVDGAPSLDATPGTDDDPLEVGDNVAWDVERNYIHTLPAAENLTVEDYYQGWFVRNGAGFQQAAMDHIFVTLAGMPFYSDGFEDDDAIGSASTVTPVAYSLGPNQVVINEIELGAADALEFYNGTANAVDLTGWQFEVYANGITNDPTRIYTFPVFSLNPGEVVAVHEGGSQTANGRYHLYAGDRTVFNASWNPGIDGAVVLRNLGGTPVDFVKWRGIDANGDPYDNTTPVPAGLSFTGNLDTPSAPQTLARDVSGNDTDQATDLSGHFGSLGSSNHPSPRHQTVFDVGDLDLVSFTAAEGTRYGFEARGPYSASDPLIELLTSSGEVLGSNDNADGSVRDARLDFYASTAGTYYVRVSHVGELTDWADYDLLAFQRPVSSVFAPPSGASASAHNASDVADPVDLQWVNAGAYDSVRVYRDGALIVAMAGSPSSYTDAADRGLHRYEVSGVLAGAETPRASDYEFAGIVHCHAEDDFESGSAAQWIREGSTWDVTPFAQSGTFGFTDSPAGTYQGCPDPLVRPCPVNANAVFGIPSNLTTGLFLRWDQICITEHCEGTPCDVCIVEVSTNDGGSWTEVARFDQASDPAWADNVADPTDWRPAEVSLLPFAGQQALVRFRLQSDQLLELDGWYVDNVRVAMASCEAVGVEDVRALDALEFLPPSPNPARGQARFSFALPRSESRVDIALYDVGGRLVRMEHVGPRAPGLHSWVWDGRDRHGRRAASGVYYARLLAGTQILTRKVLMLAP